MSRWLTIAGVVLVLFWAPFLYSELTSEPAAKKDRAGVEEDLEDDGEDEELVPIDDGDPTAEEPEGEDEEPAEPEPVAEGVAPAEGEAPEMEPQVQEELPSGAAEAEGTEEAEAEAEADEMPAAPSVLSAGPTGVLKGAFEVEHRDGFWAPEAEAKIAQLFAHVEAPEGSLESAECRKRVCRVEMAWDQEHATLYTDVYGAIREEFGTEVGVEPVVAAPAAAEEGDQEGAKQVQKVVLYLPRKGYSVADISE